MEVMREADEDMYLQFLRTIRFLRIKSLDDTEESEATMHWKTIL